MIDGMFVMDVHCHTYPVEKTYWGVIGQTYDQWLARMDRNHLRELLTKHGAASA